MGTGKLQTMLLTSDSRVSITKMLILFTIPTVLGLIAYTWIDLPVPDGFLPESARELKKLVFLVKAIDFMGTAAYSVGIGSSIGDNNRRITSALMNLASLGLHGSDSDVKETDMVFDGVPVRLYEPANRKEILAGIVYFHGGGWIFGNLDTPVDIVRRMCKEINVIVVSVDYRLAPDHVFPAAVDDCVLATKYFMSNAAQFNVNRHRIAVAGDSAGGNLAAAVALKLRDDGFQPMPKLQVLLYPVVQGLDFHLPSYVQNAEGPLITRRMMACATLMYLLGNDEKLTTLMRNEHVPSAVRQTRQPYFDVSKLPSKYLTNYTRPHVSTVDQTLWNEMKDKLLNPYFAPLIADRLDNLPAAYVFTTEYDPLRDEGFLYAQRLEQSGVKVTHHHSDIGVHGVLSIPLIIPETEHLFPDMASFISENL